MILDNNDNDNSIPGFLCDALDENNNTYHNLVGEFKEADADEDDASTSLYRIALLSKKFIDDYHGLENVLSFSLCWYVQGKWYT